MPGKRFVGIPVRGSKRILSILPEIAFWADKVRIYATEVDFSGDEIPSNVEVRYSVPELSKARAAIADWAVLGGAEYVYQIDDDTDIPFPWALGLLEYHLETYTFLGAVCTMPELLAFYNKGRESNRGFLLVPSPTQVWGMRLDAYSETTGFDTVETMEDIYVGLSMWFKGYATATLPQVQHKHKRPRLSHVRVGGTPPSERDGYMESCMNTLRSAFLGSVLKSIRLSTTKAGILKLSPRYNWEEMGKRVRDRWGPIGYSDGRMEI